MRIRNRQRVSPGWHLSSYEFNRDRASLAAPIWDRNTGAEVVAGSMSMANKSPFLKPAPESEVFDEKLPKLAVL